MPESSTKPIYFISDLHLGASYLRPRREYEARIVRFLESLHGKASQLIMLGDVLDYWFEYRAVVPRGYVRFFGALARLVDSGVKVTWFTGNHDIWLFDYLRDEIGLEIIDRRVIWQLLGKRFLLAHGDREGKVPTGFRIIQWLFRNRVAQRLYAFIPPAWTIPFAHGWSSSSRDFSNYIPPQFDPDTNPLVKFARDYDRQHPSPDEHIDYYIFGHQHLVADQPIGDKGARMIILGDWITNFSFGKFDGNEFSLHFFEDKKE